MMGMGVQKAGSRSGVLSKQSMRWLARISISGARDLIRVEVKDRRTELRSFVWRGGSSSNMECSSISMKGWIRVGMGSTNSEGIARPQFLSRRK